MGNQMFLVATLYAIARDSGFPLVDDSLGYYFQDHNLFQRYEQEIKKLYGEGIPEKTDMIAIHVRRGGNPVNPNEPNYSENNFYVNLMETPYYRDAMAQFPGADFLVFSDDIEWCKRQKIFEGCEFSEGKTELEDMNLMASCVGIIMANSSYSWWSSYISPYAKKIIAPLAWYRDEDQERTKCPDSWLRM